MKEFDHVVIRNRTKQEQNIHLAVHPFMAGEEGIVMMTRRGNYGDADLPEWKQRLADKLWDTLPGLHRLFFLNGEITIQHGGVFEDAEIFEVASAIIRPALEAQLLLASIE